MSRPVDQPDADPYWSLITSIIEDADARPVAMRLVEQRVEPGARIAADCPGHGRVSVPADPLLRIGRRADKKQEGDKLAPFIVTPGKQ